jgi:hypothetical protein
MPFIQGMTVRSRLLNVDLSLENLSDLALELALAVHNPASSPAFRLRVACQISALIIVVSLGFVHRV